MPCRVKTEQVPMPFAAELVPWLELVLVVVAALVIAVAPASAAVADEMTMIAVGHGPESRGNDTSW